MNDIPDITSLPSEVAPINPSEFIMPAGEALHNAGITQSEVKSDYKRRVEEQYAIRAKYLAHIKREEEELKKDPDAIKFKLTNLKDQHDALHESLHYAKQDYDALLNNADLTGRTSASKAIVDRMEREIYDVRQQISQLNGLL